MRRSLPEYMDFQKMNLITRSLANVTRQQILKFLLEKKGATVTDIRKEFKMEQSIASTHIKRLNDCRVLEFKRKGKYKIYTVKTAQIDALKKVAETFLELVK